MPDLDEGFLRFPRKSPIKDYTRKRDGRMKSTVPQYNYCNLNTISKSVENPLTGANLSSKDAGTVDEEARDLANRAYNKNEDGARGLAERLLYLIHAKTAFSGPMDTVGSRMWPVLIRAKLTHDLE